MTKPWWLIVLAAIGIGSAEAILVAHSGPPFPIVSNRIVGAYDISIWSDPDSTDDGTAGGRFWLVLDAAERGRPIPAGTRATVTIRPLDRDGASQSGEASVTDGEVTRQFIALVMDHEGPFNVRLSVAGPLGPAEVEASVDATYDERPSAYLMAVYLFPFVSLGAIWMKVLLRRRRIAKARQAGPVPSPPA